MMDLVDRFLRSLLRPSEALKSVGRDKGNLFSVQLSEVQAGKCDLPCAILSCMSYRQ